MNYSFQNSNPRPPLTISSLAENVEISFSTLNATDNHPAKAVFKSPRKQQAQELKSSEEMAIEAAGKEKKAFRKFQEKKLKLYKKIVNGKCTLSVSSNITQSSSHKPRRRGITAYIARA